MQQTAKHHTYDILSITQACLENHLFCCLFPQSITPLQPFARHEICAKQSDGKPERHMQGERVSRRSGLIYSIGCENRNPWSIKCANVARRGRDGCGEVDNTIHQHQREE